MKRPFLVFLIWRRLLTGARGITCEKRSYGEFYEKFIKKRPKISKKNWWVQLQSCKFVLYPLAERHQHKQPTREGCACGANRWRGRCLAIVFAKAFETVA